MTVPRLRRSRTTRACLLALMLLVAAGETAAQDLATEAEGRATLAGLMRHALQDELLAPWYPRAVDEEDGGFLSRFTYRWEPVGPQRKMIVSQARHVWTTARAAGFLADAGPYRSAAEHGYRFLRNAMWDDAYGGFFWMVDKQGAPLPEEDGRLVKQAYGNAFGIYALAAYYDVTGDTSALRLAQRTFRWLDEHAYDAVHGGYYNYTERDGTALPQGHAGTPPKDQNSSIHLLEAFTELYHVWPDPTLRERLQEMLVLVRDRLTVEPGYLQLFFTEDWTHVSYRDSSRAVHEANLYFDHVSFGHDVETAYLMLEAAEALGLDPEPTLRAGKRMVDHSLRTGWDHDLGGFYEAGYYLAGDTTLTVLDATKNWWAQAEGLNTLLLMGDRFPDDPLDYHRRFLDLWAYTQAFLVDHEYGGWYDRGIAEAPSHRTAVKGQIWKAAYHDSRALMNIIRRLEGE